MLKNYAKHFTQHCCDCIHDAAAGKGRRLLSYTVLVAVCLLACLQAKAQTPWTCYNDASGANTPPSIMYVPRVPFPITGQFCGGWSDNPPPNTLFGSFFRKQMSFSPQNPTILPATVKKKIKVRLVVLDPSPNGQKVTYRPSDNAALVQFINRTNQVLASLSAPTNPQPSVCGSCYQPDSRLRLELTDIDYVYDPYLSYGPGGSTGYTASGKYQDSILNIYFTYKPTETAVIDTTTGAVGIVAGAWANTPARFGSFAAPNNSFIVLRNYFITNADLNNAEPRRLVHELGHVLDLHHLFDGDEYDTTDRDFLTDVFGPNATSNVDTLPNNNFLSANATGAGYMSPQQLGREHRSLMLSTARGVGYPDEAPSLHPWVITQNQTWDFPLRMYQNIRINAGATLTIRCQVEMPDKSNIIIEPGGKLVVDGGIITSYHSRIGWAGIQVKGNSHMPSQPQYQGTLEMKNGAVIQNAWEGVWNYSPENYFTDGAGGIIKVENSYFYNCNKAADIASYETYSYSYNGASTCYFKNVDFLIDARSPFTGQYSQTGYEYFTTDRIKSGVQILNSRFRNTIPYTQQVQYNRGAAVRLFETGMTISGCTFDGFMEGVRLHGYTGSPRTLTLMNNKFNHITRNIVVAASGFSSIRGNTITNIINSDTNNFVQPGWGVFMDNAKGVYMGCGNSITGTTDYIQDRTFETFDRRGVVIQDSRTFGGTVIDNTFNKIAVGSQTQRDNPNFNIFCNTYTANKAAWKVNPQTTNSNFHDQGTGCQGNQTRAGNKFIGNTKDIYNYINTPWRYRAWAPDPQQVPTQSGFNGIDNCSPPGSTGIDPNSQCLGIAQGTRPNINACSVIPISTTTLQATIKNYHLLSGQGMKQDADAIMLYNQVINGFYDLEDEDGLVTFLEEENNDNARRLLIPLYIERFRFSDAQNAIAALQIEPAERSGFAHYYQLLMNLKADSRTINDLDESEWNTVAEIAHDDLEVSAFAKALLDKAGREEWRHIVEEAPEESGTFAARSHMPMNSDASKLGAAIPNPAKNSTTINVYVSVEDAARQPTLLLRNAMGATIARFALKAGSNEVTVNLANYTAGYYFYTFQIGNRNTDSKKLILVK